MYRKLFNKIITYKIKCGININALISLILCYSVKESDWSEKLIIEMNETEWLCQNCGLQTILSSIEKIQHQNACKITGGSSADRDSESTVRKPNSQIYECPDCAQTLYLTPIEILKHKKSHKIK